MTRPQQDPALDKLKADIEAEVAKQNAADPNEPKQLATEPSVAYLQRLAEYRDRRNRNKPQARAKNFFEVFQRDATPEETSAAIEGTERLRARYPLLITDGIVGVENGTLLNDRWLKDGVLPTYETLSRAFAEVFGDLKFNIDGEAIPGSRLTAEQQLLVESPASKTPDELETMSADDFMKSAFRDCGLPITKGDQLQQQLDQKLYAQEWYAFLKTPEGRAFEKVRSQIVDPAGIDPFPRMIHQYLVNNGLRPSSGAFREAAVEAARQFSVQLTFEDAGVFGHGSTVMSYQGGRQRQRGGL
jgi:hypothetical protein